MTAPANVRLPAPRARADRLRVCLVARDEPGTTGTSRYVDHMVRALPHLGATVISTRTRPRGAAARALGLGRRAGLDLNTFLAQYPVVLRWPPADVYHLTVQTYASVLFGGPPPGPIAVTVHDIIPYLTRHDRRLRPYGHPVHRFFDWLAMRGLQRAGRRGALIADSSWTKQTLVETLGLAEEAIAVVPLGVDGERFRPVDVPASIRERYGLPLGYEYILYVGSEDPRKNLDVLLRAFAGVHRAIPAARLIKVGAAHHQPERERLIGLAEHLGIATAVRFVDHVADVDLPYVYGASAVSAMPSAYEGFGLPVLEAMACGIPVVCAAAAALPEVAGNGAARLTPPDEPRALAEALLHLLREPGQRMAQAQRGRARAATYTWGRTAEATFESYVKATQRRIFT